MTAVEEMTNDARELFLEMLAEIWNANEWDGELDALPPELFVELLVNGGKHILYSGRPLLQFVPAWVATLGAMHAIYLLRQATDDANGLEKYLADALPEERMARLQGLLEARMNGWAAAVELVHLQERMWKNSSQLAVAIDTFEDTLDVFDRAFEKQSQHMAGLPKSVFKNYRAILAPRFLDPLPWWLDGRLES